MPEDTQQEPLPPVNPALTDSEIIDEDVEIELDEESMKEAGETDEALA